MRGRDRWTIDVVEWQGAQHVNDFRKVQPLNGEPATPRDGGVDPCHSRGPGGGIPQYPARPAPRTLQRVQRDFEDQVDRVNVMIDFDGDHRTGYDFTVSNTDGISDAIITNETNFNSDWDGNWQHAVASDARAGRPRC